jgi:hypothetical protein
VLHEALTNLNAMNNLGIHFISNSSDCHTGIDMDHRDRITGIGDEMYSKVVHGVQVCQSITVASWIHLWKQRSIYVLSFVGLHDLFSGLQFQVAQHAWMRGVIFV